MNWLIFVVIAVLSDSLRIFIDNYTSDVYFKGKDAASQKLFYGYGFIIASLIILGILHFDITQADPLSVGLIMLSGVFSAVAGIAYFRALELDDSTNIGIFTQLAPVFYLILGWFFLNESFSPMQLVSFAIILCAPFLIVFTTKKRSRKIRLRAVLFAFLYVLIAVIGNLLFVKADNGQMDFDTELALLLFAKGIADIVVVYAYPKWRKRFRTVATKSKYKVLRPLSVNLFIGLIKEFSYRAALVSAPAVALASVSSDSAEPIVIFFMGLLLTLIWPKFGREKLDKKTVCVHFLATILVVVGIILMQV